MLYRNSPINEPKGTFVYGSNSDYETPKKKNKLSKRGFGVIMFGFVIQLLSLIYKTIFLNSI